MSWFDNDICWCYNSSPEYKDGEEMKCNYTDCFRHLSNRRKQSAPDIFTCSFLKGTEYCPHKEEGE